MSPQEIGIGQNSTQLEQERRQIRGERSARRELDKLTRRTTVLDSTLEDLTPSGIIKEARLVMRRLEKFARYRDLDTAEAFEELPEGVQDVVADVFQESRFEDGEITTHISEDELAKLVAFRGVINHREEIR